MANYPHPGVYAEESNLPLLSIPTGSTAVPVFFGQFTRKGKPGMPAIPGMPEVPAVPEVPPEPLAMGSCVEVASWFDFIEQFATTAAGSVTATFTPAEAGIPESWALTELAFEPTFELGWRCLQLYFDNGGGRCYVAGLGAILPVPGGYEELRAMVPRYADITLMCSTLGAGDDSKALYESLNPLMASPKDLFLIADSADGITRPSTLSERTAVYYPGVATSYSARPAESDFLVAMTGDTTQTLAALKLDSSKEDLYGLVSQKLDAYASVTNVSLPASPAITGVYCRQDAAQGPWHAPAGILLNSVKGVDHHVTQSVFDKLLENRINAVKHFANEGVKVWGTRTMVPPTTPLWLHIPVRRLFDAAARDITSAMQVAVFMPNNSLTWASVRNAIEAYLYKIWRAGGLKGDTAAEAYYVQIGHGISMTDIDIAEGRMVVNVGMAALRPVEFIEVVFSQVLASA